MMDTIGFEEKREYEKGENIIVLANYDHFFRRSSNHHILRNNTQTKNNGRVEGESGITFLARHMNEQQRTVNSRIS